jgi:hypothetical protein
MRHAQWRSQMACLQRNHGLRGGSPETDLEGLARLVATTGMDQRVCRRRGSSTESMAARDSALAVAKLVSPGRR